ncbi:hypothetical protein AMECASPLE_026399 [Ameca splendens]|uniref:Uncharacterized protein n=1 Tax=Ameca splendens TaxID=208324 RepID=A0ABV0XU57_9TELE
MSNNIRLCRSCQTGYILSFDPHNICEGCLGPQHAHLALSLQPSCCSCELLPLEEKRRRVAFFKAAAQEAFPIAGRHLLDEAIKFFDVGQELVDNARTTVAAVPLLHPSWGAWMQKRGN